MGRSSTDRRHFITLGILIVISTLILNYLLNLSLPFPDAASAEAATIDRFFRQHVLLISFLFSLVVVVMLYAIVVFRRREGDTGEGEHFEGNLALEIGWTVAPLIFVVLFGFMGVNTLQTVTAVGENEIMVKVKGFQWAWSFEYAEGFTTQELVLPVNQRAHMEMEATDVLHAFWVPEFRVKQDLVPGQITNVRFTPTVAGEYVLRCSELCGLTHWNMLADVRILEQAEYDQWLSEMAATTGSALAATDGLDTQQ